MIDPASPIPPSSVRPPSDSKKYNSYTGLAFMRDAIPLQVFISLGALLGFAISFTPHIGKPIIALVLLLITIYPGLRALLIHYSLIPNPRTAETLPGVYTGRIPGTVAGEGCPEFCVISLTARCNSAWGPFDPTFKQIGSSMQKLMNQLAKDPNSGCLNVESFLATRRANGNSIVAFFYFRSVEDVHRFANEGLHKSYWMEIVKNHTKYTHIELEHELFTIKESGFESLHMNPSPHGAANLWDVVEDKEGGKLWESTLRKVGKGGSGGSSKGRLAGGR